MRSSNKKLMNVILRDVSRLDRLITDISRASRVDNEMASESAAVIDLRDLVSFRRATTDHKRASHQLVAEIGDTPALVEVHDGRIVQILDNLLGNAVSFAPGSRITFVLERAESGPVSLSVQDQGPGIPAGRLQEIFNRFYSGDRPVGLWRAFGAWSVDCAADRPRLWR